jgi:hypothetical protein
MVGKRCWHTVALPGALTVGVRAREGPKPTSEFVLRVPNLDGDSKRIHEEFILVQAKEDPTSSGGEYCISLHLSACVGVTSCERGSRSQVSKREYKGDCLRC